MLAETLKQYADLIVRSCGILTITEKGFVVVLADGSREVEFDGGLTEEHFLYFSPMLDDWDKAMFAKAVVNNMLPPSLSSRDKESVWWLLREEFGATEEEWLPGNCSRMGARMNSMHSSAKEPEVLCEQPSLAQGLVRRRTIQVIDEAVLLLINCPVLPIGADFLCDHRPDPI